MIRWGLHRFRHGKMSSKTLHLVVCFLFDYCVTVTAVGDNVKGAKWWFKCENQPELSFVDTYEINKLVFHLKSVSYFGAVTVAKMFQMNNFRYFFYIIHIISKEKSANANYLAKEEHDLHVKSSEVCIKTRSPPASLPIQRQVTKHTTVKWSILKPAKLCGKF